MLGLLIGLSLSSALGCVHLPGEHNRLRSTVAAATSELEHSTAAVVDADELPLVAAEPAQPERSSADPRWFPGVLLAATAPASWIPEGDASPAAQVELRNACLAEFEYAFGPSDDPAQVEAPRRVLEGSSIQTQWIPQGHWLHLWDEGRWLGAAGTTVEQSRMEIASGCDTLAVDFELPGRGPTSFAIHWELDGDLGSKRELVEPLADALGDANSGAPERWADEAVAPTIELRLLNHCADAIDYAFTATVDEDIEASATIPGQAERRVEVPVDWWLRYRGEADGWHTGAATQLGDAQIWIAPDCVDHGVVLGDMDSEVTP